MKLDRKSVLITGASGGIGRCLAHEFATQGAALILVGRDEISLARLRQSLPFSSRHHTLGCDLQSASGVHKLVNYCQALPQGLDILVNNAGMSDFTFVAAADADVTRALIELNLTVPVTLTTALLPALIKRPEAAVINIGSIFGSIGYPGFAVYGASKSGLRTFSEGLRRELADSHVRVLYVAPRATRTPMNSTRVVAMNKALGNAMDAPEKVAHDIVNRITAGRWSAMNMGWPERLFIVLNSLFPRVTDAAIHRKLPKIRQYSRVTVITSNNSISEREAV